MQIRIAAVLAVLLVSGCRVIEPEPPPTAPRVDSFTASKTRVAPGEEVTLTFATTGATKVELTDDSGNGVQLEGSVEAGTAKVAPARSSFYVLRATGKGGRDTAFLQIAVNEPLRDVFLVAVPQVIDSGQEAQLLWGAAGATTVTLKTGAGMPMPLTGTTGSIAVTPASTERYTLTAEGAPGTPPLTAITGLEVRPVLASADLVALDGIEAGKTLTFSWKTLGASRVTISEQTFGQLTSVTEPSSVAMGNFDYVLPAKLPSGVDVLEGLPLRFTVTAISGDVRVTRTIERVVGLRPVIEFFQAPGTVSEGKRFTASWKTLNAASITIAINGLPVFQTRPSEQTRVDLGEVSLPAPLAQTDYKLIATSALGVTAERSFTVRPVGLPVINTYTLTGAFNAIGEAVTARWTTTDATRVLLRFENGATLASVTNAAQVASGNVVLTPANTARITLEAWNASGDLVQQTRTVTFNGTSPTTVTPTPVFRTAAATLSWQLADAGVTEVVGLPTPAPAPTSASANFIDLATVATAEPLFFTDTNDGAQKLPRIPGFRFPLLGTVREDLWVSVNGFIAFAAPAALINNTDFADAGDTAPSMLAPLWDNLLLGPTSQILYALQTSQQGEPMLVVQWDHVQLAGDPNADLTFQAQLFETGQVTFVYKNIAPAVTSVTVGVKDTVFPAAQQFAFNSTTTQPVTGLELNYFTGGPADGTVGFKAGTARRLEFVGRTATGRVPVSAEVRSFAAGEVTVNEVMALPEASVTATGQWIELRNNTAVAIDFEGLRVDTLNSGDAGFVLPPGSSVDAGAMLVLGQSVNPLDNGGATVEVAAALALRAIDRVRVSLGTSVLTTFTYDAGVPGTSMQPPGEDLSVAASRTYACNRTQTFGALGSLGTPGARNESCASYTISSIPGRFTAAPAGSEVLTEIDSDDAFGTLTLPQPFTYFGTATTNAQLSTNGFVSLGVPGLPTVTNNYSVNGTTVATTNPNGAVAPFWDDLFRDANGKNAMWREADRTIISWEGFSQFDAQAETSINMQVHLLDNGTIEFHYGDMSSSSLVQSTAELVTGSSATVWLESQDGVVATVSSINRPNSIAPNSGIRFTPRP